MDRPTLIVGATEDGLSGLTFEGFDPPENLRVIERDYTRGSVPDADGIYYLEEDVTDSVL